MSIWASVSKMLVLLFMVYSVFGATPQQRRGPRLCLGGFYSQPRCAHELEITQEGVSKLPAKERYRLIWRTAAGHKHANRDTHTNTHTQRDMPLEPNLPLLVFSGQMAPGFWVASFCSPAQLEPFFCGESQAVG